MYIYFDIHVRHIPPNSYAGTNTEQTIICLIVIKLTQYFGKLSLPCPKAIVMIHRPFELE